MTWKRVALFAILFSATLSAYVWAQVIPPRDVISGDRIGFQLEWVAPNRAGGKLLVYVNGKWVPAQITYTAGITPTEIK